MMRENPRRVPCSWGGIRRKRSAIRGRPSHVLRPPQRAVLVGPLRAGFLRHVVVGCRRTAWRRSGATASVLADAEGLAAHRLSSMSARALNGSAPSAGCGWSSERGHAHGAIELARERQLAVQDLVESNRFVPEHGPPGPYAAEISLQGERMLFLITPVDSDSEPTRVTVPVADLTGLVRDYHAICQSYYDALQRASVGKIEAIDMGRRALHDEGAGLLAECLKAGSRRTSTPRAACSRCCRSCT